MRIIVTSGYHKSLHAVALIHRLAAHGHQVVGCLCVRVFSRARMRFYLRQLGWKKAVAKARARFGRRASSSSTHAPNSRVSRTGTDAGAEVAPMLDYLREHNITARTVPDACKAVGATCHAVKSLNDANTLKIVKAAKHDLIVYGGGGIVRRGLLDLPKIGVLNGHGGPLPAFRGMNAAEWSLFYGVPPSVCTILLDAGIDTGPTIHATPIPLNPGDSISALRGMATRVTVEALLDSVSALADGSAEPQPQEVAAGRQFFVMADPLLEVLADWMQQGATPRAEAEPLSFASVQPPAERDPHLRRPY